MDPSQDRSAQSSEVAILIDALKKALSADDPTAPATRQHLKDTAENLSLALETPGETAQRIAYYPTRTTVVRIANKLRIFHLLVESHVPVTSKGLAQKTGADHLLLLRLLRFLVAMRAIGNPGVDSYVANSMTKNLVIPRFEAGINYTYDVPGRANMALHSFLAKTNYQNPTDPRNCPLQEAFHTRDNLFEWLPKNPEYLNYFDLWMTGQHDGRANWLDFFPFEERVTQGFKESDGAIMFVDVGGGRGKEIEAIKKRYPTVPGRILLQDLPDTVAQALIVPGMEVIAHDFFTEQSMKGQRLEAPSVQTMLMISPPGARAYFLGGILHDWPDDKCQLILSHLASAMTPGYSKIILHELVIPDQGCGMVAAQLDITMMSVLAATERSESHWHDVVGSAGLKIEKIWTEVPESESIIELGLK